MNDDDNNLLIMNREMAKIKKDFLNGLLGYRRYMETCQLDAPLEVLCLPKNILSILSRSGFTRVAEITSNDLTKIKGLGPVKLANLNSRLQEFFPS